MTEPHGIPENPAHPPIPHNPAEPITPTPGAVPDAGQIYPGPPLNPADYMNIPNAPQGQTYPGDPSMIANYAAPPIPPQPEASASLGTKHKIRARWQQIRHAISTQWQRTQRALTPWWHRFLLLVVILYFLPIALLFVRASWTTLAKAAFGSQILSSLGVINDSHLEYFSFFAIVIFSAIVAAIWALIERKFTHPKIDTVIQYIGKNGLRLCLSGIILYYGMVKFIPAQMHAPWPTELAKPLGEQDAQSYLWHFMGFSPLFEIIVGLLELIGGILLLIPRFTTLGGYLSLGIILPTTVIVLCYDVPLKLISIVILLGLIILIWPSITALSSYLIRHKGVKPLAQPRLISLPKTWQRTIGIIVYIIASISVITLDFFDAAVLYDGAQLNPDLAINGRWIITNRRIGDPQLFGVLPQQWTDLDITATNNTHYSHFNVELDMGVLLGASHMDFPAAYNDRYIIVGTKGVGLLPYNLAFNYVIQGDNLTLLALNADTNRPSLILTAKRAIPWLHHPGEFHWIVNPREIRHNLIDP